jgi:restriction endonuclease S subunit
MELHKAQSEIGYETLRLGELLKSEPAAGVRMSDDDGQPTPYVETEAVSQGPPLLTRVPKTFRFGDPKGRLVERGDLLLVSRGVERLSSIPCAKVDFDGQAAYSQSLVRLRINDELVDPDYLRLYLSSRRGAAVLAAAATGSVISNLRRDALSDVEIHLPDLSSQKRVVEEFVKIEELQVDLREALSGLQSLHETGREGVMNGVLSPVGGSQ